jgi:hypothetical protein
LGVLWNRTEFSSQFILEQADLGTWRRNVIDPLIRRSCQETATKVVGDQRGIGVRRSDCAVRPIRKALVVMSQWAHYHWN